MRELSLNIMDIVQNSLTAQASVILITVEEQTHPPHLQIQIADNGCGMTEAQLLQMQSPFYTTRTTRSVGLGIPLFKMACEMTGGSFSIRSQPGQGTQVCATFCPDHIDMTPLGNLNETILMLITCNPTLDFIYTRTRDAANFALDTRELRDVLGDVALHHPDVTQWIRQFLQEADASLLEK